MPSRSVIAVWLVLLLALSGSVCYALWERDTRILAEAQVKALTDKNKAQARSLGAVQAELQRQRNQRKEVDRALDEVPEWRDSRVPDAVYDGLCKRLRCS